MWSLAGRSGTLETLGEESSFARRTARNGRGGHPDHSERLLALVGWMVVQLRPDPNMNESALHQHHPWPLDGSFTFVKRAGNGWEPVKVVMDHQPSGTRWP